MSRNSGAPAPWRTAVRMRLRFGPEKGENNAREKGALGEPHLYEREVRVRETQRTEKDTAELAPWQGGVRSSWLFACLQLQPFANLDSTRQETSDNQLFGSPWWVFKVYLLTE